MTKHHTDRYEKRFNDAVEAEFGKGATFKTEGVKERFIDNPKDSDPALPFSLRSYGPDLYDARQRIRAKNAESEG